MPVNLIADTKPSEWDLKTRWMDLELGGRQQSEKETVLRNTVVMLKYRGDQWRTFTWDDYVEYCGGPDGGPREVSPSEQGMLNRLRKRGYFTGEDDGYTPTEALLSKIWKLRR